MRKALGRDQWDRALAIAQTIAECRPHFGKGRPPHVDVMCLNPFADKKAKQKQVRGIPIEGNLGEKLLDAMSVEET